MKNKKCEYRNCNNDLNVIRTTKRFCCTNCRMMEKTYLKRHKIKLEKYRNKEMELVNTIKQLKNLINLVHCENCNDK